MTPLEEEITKLSYIWYRFVGLDHHKDRDCHWYIQQYYSYGQPPYFQAQHWGYHTEFEGTKCTTIEEAQEELRDRLLLEIHDAKKWVSRNLKQAQEAKPEDDYWGGSENEYTLMMNALNGIFKDNNE